MENGNGCASGNGVLIAVSTSSEAFQSNILSPLRCAYLYEESKRSFRYNSAVLIRSPEQEKKYNAFRAKRRELGYSEEDLEESYGFLLFDDTNKAHALGETGVLTGNSTCTTLGDPTKGVYISVYSDCLAPNRWYHGKTGYIVIIKLTKGRVKKVLENYTQNFTAPTEGFDCHVSEQFPTVSAKTSSFLAFERAQYYMYELLDGGSNETVQSPSAACPFAIVSFSYTDTKATFFKPPEISEAIKLVCHYFPWRGQLQIGNHFYNVGLRSTEGATIPVELPPVVKVDRAISMLDLRQLLPKTVFETYFCGEVFLDGFYCSLYRLVSSEVEQNNSFSLLLCEIKKKDVALTIPLSDGGFLFLLHSSHFLTYNDSEVLQGMFVFPESRVIHRETKIGHRKPVISSEILQALPVLSYAEGEVEKSPTDQSEELCEVFVQHMQNYAAIINPELALSPSREVSIFPDQYDVPHALKNLYSSPEWTDGMWQNLRSYLSKPVSFQLPVSKASEILSTGQEERIEDLDDDVYFCPSSPEEAPADHVSIGSEEQLTGQKSTLNVGTSLDSCISSTEAQVDPTAALQGIVLDDLQPGDVKKDSEKSDLSLLTKSDDRGTKNVQISSTSDDLPAELIVSVTSAERTVTDASVIITESKAKHDLQLSGFTLDDETVTTQNIFECPKMNTLKKPKRRKLRRRYSKGQKHASKPCVKTSNLQTVKILMEDDNLKECQTKDSSGLQQLNNSSNTYLRKLRKRKFGKPSLRNKKVTPSTVVEEVAEENKSDPGQQSIEDPILMETEACPLRKKMDRWDLKPVISECGRILVPHGCVDVSEHILKALNDEIQPREDKTGPEKMMVGVSVDAPDTGDMGEESTNSPETTVDEREATTSKGDGNHPENVIGHVDPEHSVLRQPGDETDLLTLNPEHSERCSKNSGSDSPPLQTVQAKYADAPSPERCATKGEFLLNKLKSVLLRGKRKTAMHLSKETTDAAQNTEPCFKKGKVESIEAIVRDPNVGTKAVSKMVSVDPNFAYALGLTPRETPDQSHKPEDLESQKKREDVSETQEEKQPQIIQSPHSIFPQRGRIKMLKKHQGVSAEFVKQKWWLHFQTPGFANEKLKYKEGIQDKSYRKAVKEKSNSARPPTDALNLLADLALSASHDQVPPQLDQALEGKPETNLKKCNLTKEVASVEQETVFHALLRQAAARHLQPERPPSNHLVRGSDMADLISREHAYSLPPSSSLLLDLLGAPFQLTPSSDSTSMLPHHQTMNYDGFKVLHPSVNQEDKSEHNYGTPEHLRKCVGRRSKFRHSRSFVKKDGPVQVTKHWQGNYDFNLDSKFTNDSKCRAICRALHGPWDYSVQETSKEVRFIFHMWIGLFYSKSTARFFDSDCTDPCSEESDPSEISIGMASAPSQAELKADSCAPCLNVTSTSDTLISNALDLRKKDTSILDQGSVILDLSLRNSSAEMDTSDSQVNKKETSASGQEKETSEALNTVVGLQKASTFQFCRNTVDATEKIKEVNDVRRTFGIKRMCTPLQKAGCTNQTCEPSFQCGGTLLPVQERMGNLSFQPENHLTSSRTGCVLQGCNDEKTEKKDGTKVSEAMEMSFLNKDVDSYKKVGDVVPTVEHDEMESKYVENWEEKEKPVPEGSLELPPNRTHADDSRDVETWEEKEKPVQEGILEFPPKRTHAGDSRDAETWEEKEKPVPEGSLEFPPKRTHAGDSSNVENWEEKEKPVQEGSLEFPPKRTHADDSRDVENWEEKEKPVQEGSLEFPPKRTHADDSRDVENWEEKEKPVQEGSMELSPKRIHTGTDSTNEISGIVCNGNILENEKQLSGEEPGAVSPDKATNAKQDVDCWTVHEDTVNKNDVIAKEDGLDVKDCAISDLETGNDLNDPPLPMMCDGPDTVKNDFTDRFTDHRAPLEEQPPQADKEESAYDDGPELVKEYTECKDQAPLVLQPPQAVSEEDACHDLQPLNCKSKLFTKGSALTNEIDISEKSSHASSEMRPVCNEPVVGENVESHVSSVDNTNCHKAALLMCDERPGSVDGSSTNGSIPQTSNGVETCGQNKAINSEGGNWDTKSDEGVRHVENTTLTEQFSDQSHSLQRDTVKMLDVDVALTKGKDPKSEQTNKGLEKLHIQVVNPFIGIDASGENAVQPHNSESKVEEVQGQKEALFITDSPQPGTLPPTEVCDSSQMCNEKAELLAGRILLSLPDVTAVGQPQIPGGESDDRCPTPTMDEEPFHYDTCYGPSSSGNSSSSSSFNGIKTCKNRTQKCLGKSSTLIKPPHHFHPDLDLRTQRVLQSIDKFLSRSSHSNKSGQIETADMKCSLDQTNELQETSGGKDYFRPHRSFPHTESVQAFKPNMDKDGYKTTSQTNLSHELHSYSQRPVMSVKPSKSDEIQANCKLTIESSLMSNFCKNNPITTSIDLDTKPAPVFSEKKTGNVKGNSAGQNHGKHEANELFAKSSLSDVSNSKLNSDIAKFSLLNPLYENEKRDFSKFNKISSSSPPMQSFELSKTSSRCEGNQRFGQRTEESFEVDQNLLHASTSAVDYKDNDITDDSLFLEPQSSLTCTIFNTAQKRSDSFLEQLSKRCLQDDLTQASMEQECLIFSEQMKQLLKRSKREPVHQMDAPDELNLSCSSPMTVHFSFLEEQEDAVEHFDAPSMFGLKIKVDMSNKRDLTDTTGEENTLLLPKLSKNPVEHAGVSDVTAECAGLYTAMMNDVCAAKKAPSKPTHFRMERAHPKTEPRQHFDFCKQIKRERDDCFRSNMNSVVKRHCQTKYRFYILVTSDDPFFEETKAQLEAEGHTAVQPSEFFHCEHSSSLLIILRNEDIAEHICEVPHLLKLRKSPAVKFAGIDEPDDVVNLTHQELFMRGGFIIFDRSALESLSLCNMKTMSEILQKLRRTGKWKWMLHYRDSRWLKENARLSAEAKEKKHFINWCQEVGILEVLPYHECDHSSRDQPDYLTCLVRLQVQNISARYPVFIAVAATYSFGALPTVKVTSGKSAFYSLKLTCLTTLQDPGRDRIMLQPLAQTIYWSNSKTFDTTDNSFGANGILTLTPSSILTCSPSETFTL